MSESQPRFDDDGTLWCERPSYVQLDSFLDALRARATTDPSLAPVMELRDVLPGRGISSTA